ncbi:MAG: LCP family protein [Clostridia bacterium]|nr:LCP family protein [Clostridia bacterium]
MNGREQRKNTRQTMLKIVTVLLVIVLLFSTVMFLFSWWERYHNRYPNGEPQGERVLTYNGKDYVLRDGIETLLVLGLDTYAGTELESYNNNKQADFLLLLVIDTKNDTCKGIHINRDTITDMNVLGVAGDRIDTVRQQIALSHTYGNGREVSCRNTANAVSDLLGVKVDHYLSVTMDAVPIYNDLVGGVTLEVLDDFTSVDPTMKEGETITLTGEQALSYVRARKGLEDPSNSRRMIRQKQYLEALYERSRRCVQEQEDFVSRAALAMAEYMVSDCSGNHLESLMTRYAQEKLDTIHSIDGELVKGERFMEFYPDADDLLQTVIECFYEPAE